MKRLLKLTKVIDGKPVHISKENIAALEPFDDHVFIKLSGTIDGYDVKQTMADIVKLGLR